MNAYPEHEKLAAVRDQSQACGEFLEWLRAKGFVIARYGSGRLDHELFPANPNVERLLAEHFGVDLVKLDAEKRRMLDDIRANA